MANVELRNRAKMTTATVGTGTITLGAAVAAYQTFAVAGVEDGDTVRYLIEDGDDWEYGYGVYSALTLTRNVQESSVGDDLTKISLSGTAVVSITVGAEDFRGKYAWWVDQSYMHPSLTNGPARGLAATSTNLNIIATLDFDAVTSESAQFAVGMPPGWNGGTVSFIPAWSHAATATNFGVSWKMQGRVFRDGEAIDAALGAVVESADTGGLTDRLYIGPEVIITLANNPVPGPGQYAHFRIARDPVDAQDNLAIDARLHGIWLIWSSNMATDGLGVADGTPPP